MYENVTFVHGGEVSSKAHWKHPKGISESTELLIITKGTIYLSIANSEYILTPGDVVCIKNGTEYEGTRYSSSDISFFWVRFSCLKPEDLPPLHIHTENLSTLKSLCKHLKRFSSDNAYPKESSDYLIRLILIELTSEKIKSAAKNNFLYINVKKWIDENTVSQVKVTDIASRFGYSEDHLNKVFRQFYPSGIKDYIDKTRLQSIKNDLRYSSLTLNEIADKYSFTNYRALLKYFKYHEGISPTKFRQIYYRIPTNKLIKR